ncbi:Hypothetical protein PBC10988_23600 [Planctomycetales bacterium 10988]|nr:Hypothetical protein PBC10988_23600 [Planctomycetales bacterium 10988]
MNIKTDFYIDQHQRWPQEGHHILTQYDETTILVYQAYHQRIGEYALKHGHFGGEFRFDRMSWIKPNFLWMMYRSDWGRAAHQEVVLGIRLRRTFFDLLLEQAVWSSFKRNHYESKEMWKAAVTNSDVRLQWDPDHFPTGEKCGRRAIQLGLRGDLLEAFACREMLEVIDLRPFLNEQRPHRHKWQSRTLRTPLEFRYQPTSEVARARIGLDSDDLD